MRLSLWQQFSSNHSGGFDLVGQFKTPEDAQKAYDTVWNIISRIADYYHEHPEWAEQVWIANDLIPLTPFEQVLAKEYGLKEWEYTVDWAEAANDNGVGELKWLNVARGLSVYENLLFLHNFTETWLGAQPFDELLEKMGEKIVSTMPAIGDEYPVVNISCSALNETVANAIVEALSSSRIVSPEDTENMISLPNDIEYNGSIFHDKERIEIRDLPTYSWISEMDIAEFLPKLEAYLRDKGCINFEYSVASTNHD